MTPDAPLLDLVIQSTGLSTEAVDAFRVALLAPRTRRHADAARFFDVPADAQTRRIAQALAAYWHCDATLVQPALRTADMRLLVLDMDSTAIAVEGIDELAALAGHGPAVAAITESAMRGEIADYAQSLRRRVALLAGTELALAEQVRDRGLPPTPGARELVTEARRIGWSTFLVSGGFSLFAQAVARELGFDESWANELGVRDGRLTGEVSGPADNDGAILDAAGKARILQRQCARLGCAPQRAIAVGDGANDLDMIALAGLSVAYRAKPQVRQRAACTLDHARLDGLLELFADRW